jgi:hypothetical protein
MTRDLVIAGETLPTIYDVFDEQQRTGRVGREDLCDEIFAKGKSELKAIPF